MRLGATLAHLSPDPPYAVGEWARRLVDAGFDSLWTPEVIGRGPLVPDPFVVLAAAAAATERVELGTATLQVPLHHPVELAHRILSLAAVCGDRLSVGVGPGSTAADAAALDRDHSARFRAFDEHLERLRVLLADGRDGRADLGATADLPLLLGSWGAKVERAAREFDGWLASDLRRTADEVVAAHGRYRPPGAGGRSSAPCACPGRTTSARRGERLRRYADAGVDDAVVLIEPGGPDPERVRALLP